MRRHLQHGSTDASRRPSSRILESGTLTRCVSKGGDSRASPSIELSEWQGSKRTHKDAPAADTMLTEKRSPAATRGPQGVSWRHPRKQARQGLLAWLQRRNISLWGTLLLSVLVLVLGPLSPEAVETASSPALVGLDNTDLSSFTREQQPSAEFMEDGAPFRRLSNVVEWAAEIEGVLRLSPRLSLYIGIFLTLAGSLLMAGGSTLMKLGLSIEDEAALRTQSCDQQWLWGFAAYVAGACLHVIALGFAPASVLSPMNSIGLIANAVASAELLFTGGCAFGVFLCACASVLPRTEFVDMGGEIDVRYIGLYSWRDPWYLAFLGACCGLGFGALVYLNSVESALLEEREQQLLREADRGIGLLTLNSSHAKAHLAANPTAREAVGSSLSILAWLVSVCLHVNHKIIIPALLRSPCNLLLLLLLLLLLSSGFGDKCVLLLSGLCYGFLAGIVGSQCILEVKEIGTCVRYGLSESSIWFSPQPYLVCCFLGISVWLQIHFLNLGLARGDATTIVPTYYVVWTFFGTLGGFAKFHEVQGFSAGALVLFGLGFGLTAMCIILLAVEEMQNLRRYVDQQVPEYSDEEADLAAQEIVEQRLSKHVTFAMGMFPISSLGRTAGRRRFRPIYQRFRRTRSTASDTALGDAYGELTIGSSSVAGAYTLPPNIHFPRRSIDSYVIQAHGDSHQSPSHAISLQSSSPSRSLDAISRASLGSTHQPSRHSEEAQGRPASMVSRISTNHLMPPSLRSSYQSQ
ncbi:hypothetical protein Emed_003234 [Eimeria media]